MDAWSTANCSDVAFLVVCPVPDVDPGVDPPEVELASLPVVPVVDDDCPEAAPVVPLVAVLPVDEDPVPEELELRAELRALSSWLTFLMSLDTLD
jgi:hypothetical protein